MSKFIFEVNFSKFSFSLFLTKHFQFSLILKQKNSQDFSNIQRDKIEELLWLFSGYNSNHYGNFITNKSHILINPIPEVSFEDNGFQLIEDNRVHYYTHSLFPNGYSTERFSIGEPISSYRLKQWHKDEERILLDGTEPFENITLEQLLYASFCCHYGRLIKLK